MDRVCFLEAFAAVGRLHRTAISKLPFVVGRAPDCDLVLATSRISRRHARFEHGVDGEIVLTDLGSTNGTFLNHQRIGDSVVVSNGDVVHFAETEFRFIEEAADALSCDTFTDDDHTLVGMKSLQQRFSPHARQFVELLERAQVEGYIQPIVDGDGKLLAYELLGRGTHPDLPPSPGVLIALSESMDKAVEFSELLRRVGLAQAAAAGIAEPIFFNTHPRELDEPDRLMAELVAVRERWPALQLVLEIHEAAVTNLKLMEDMKSRLQALNIGLAYDDFGAGQARLLELIEVTPDVLKFDQGLIAKLDTVGSPHHRFLGTLSSLVQDMGCRTLAECVETKSQVDICRDLGIELYQGYFFGKPRPI